MTSLTQREADVLKMRRPINGDERRQYTYREVGEALHITAERVRQIEYKAIKKLMQLYFIDQGDHQ